LKRTGLRKKKRSWKEEGKYRSWRRDLGSEGKSWRREMHGDKWQGMPRDLGQ